MSKVLNLLISWFEELPNSVLFGWDRDEDEVNYNRDNERC